MNRQTGIIATVVAAVLCGCPGLLGCFGGAITAGASQVPGAQIDVFGSSDPQTALLTGIGTVCVSLVLIAIPIAVGFFTLRKKPDQTAQAM